MNVFYRHGLSKNTVVFVFVLSAARCCQAYNLDVRFPVVKEGKTAGSLFGFSVAFHEQVVGEKRYLLLVGAPKEKAESGLLANETGDIYACQITADPKDCERLNLLNSHSEDSSYLKNNIIDGMWLGVSIVSQSQPGGRVLACGHRYTRNFSTNFRMIGKCFVRGNDLKYDSTDSQWQSNDEVCDPSKDQTSEGMCLAGMSAAVTQTKIFFGAPGCFNWQGNTFSHWHNPVDEFDKVKSKLLNMNNKGNIYIGYSVTVDQDVLSKGRDTVVTGAPRDEARGSVMMVEVSDNGVSEKVHSSIMGEQVGSYFGNSIAVVDINNDSWKDLIVGAPFYFDRSNDTGGAVYIYLNQGGKFLNKSDVVLTGPKHSAFGMAVVAIGDVNQDGFQDFAVGAPYHNKGRVSIWMGSNKGISQTPSQVIDGKDIPGAGFQTFGYSISGGMDVDRNSYPDIAVGSLDDRVVLLRARPVIHLKSTFTVTPAVINPQTCDACIEAKVCFSYTFSTGTGNSQKNIIFQYTVEADLHSSRSTRVRFLDNKEGKYTGKMSINPSGDCNFLKLELESKTIQNKVAPIVFLLSVSLVEPLPSGGQTLEDLSAFPVISQRDALTARAEIHIQKECGIDNKCESNLQMTAMFTDDHSTPFPTQNGHQMFHYSTDKKKLKLMVNVSNVESQNRKAEDAYRALLNVTIPSSLSYASLNPKNLNVEYKLGDAYLLCTLGDPFKRNQRVEIEITFETSGITIDMQEIQTELQLSTWSEQNDLQPLSRVLMVEYILKPNFNILNPSITTEFSGNVIGESAMKSTSDIGSPVEFNITVDLSGKPLGNLGFLEVVFQWPYAVANKKWLLYLSEIQMTGTSEPFCVPKNNIVNPLNLTVSERKSGRRKRDEGSLEPEQTEPQASLNARALQSKKTEKLDCSKGSALCQTFTCPLFGMNTTADLTVRARVWNSTMLEDYKALGVVVLGSATLVLKTDKPTIKMDNFTRELTVFIDPAMPEELPYKAPLWIIIVSVLAGVILLGLIIILLWKCGFFKRANTRELYEAKAQKAEMKTQPSENDRLTEED
ncbi:integrin alpha-3 isoform X2 [Ctenopharyngodon idella]|uniref:integrin alpha-3 isoform X2 n=1 Tax=Ctenopharyngodon idella TaxID=7959 RepID=UPI0022308924|nr:integrin alpha-3 isoform X2 [Ctenopharyngodon idella]XP_051744565.1 integrin alpha-3 isoform X2 [Ctenopharyngodon idella]XP_051744566.1 integrin alpha-3 isoform X2 [Ctenopharyngodon idella]